MDELARDDYAAAPMPTSTPIPTATLAPTATPKPTNTTTPTAPPALYMPPINGTDGVDYGGTYLGTSGEEYSFNLYTSNEDPNNPGVLYTPTPASRETAYEMWTAIRTISIFVPFICTYIPSVAKRPYHSSHLIYCKHEPMSNIQNKRKI